MAFAQGDKNGNTFNYLTRLEYDKFEQRAYLAYGNGTRTQFAYDARNRRLSNLQAATQGRTFQNLGYRYDNVGNILGLQNQVTVPPPNTYGGPTAQSFVYDDLYRLTQASGTYDFAPNKRDRYSLNMAYDTIHNITGKNQVHEVVVPGGQAIAQKKTSYHWNYEYASSHPHAVTHLGERSYRYDANGNQLGWDHDRNGTRRNIVWDEENRIQSVFDNGHEKTYKYDDQGERVIKRGPQGETAYVNQWYTVRNREIASKHVWAGTTRIATALVPGVKPVPGNTPGNGNGNNGQGNGQTPPPNGSKLPLSAQQAPGILKGQGLAKRSAQAAQHARNLEKNPHYAGTVPGTPPGGGNGNPPGGPNAVPQENFLYYYHPDHLGSSSYVTDADGKPFEHLEYFPFGETWVEESSNTQRTPYLFTAKELDEETGLYYFGARYYDPRTSVWQSPDPILAKYLSSGNNKNLPGMGGVYNSLNLGLYSYSHLNPIKFLDPDGRETTVKEGKIYISPENKTVPSINISNTVGAIGLSRDDTYFHKYQVMSPTGLHGSESARALGQGIANNPVPVPGQPATPNGTRNNAGPIPTAGENNFVKSFLVPSPDPSKYTDITVNYTIKGEHGLAEGFVMRFGEIGPKGTTITLRSYGEGNAWRQMPLLEPFWQSKVQEVWQKNQQEIIKDVIQRKTEQ